MNDTLTHTAAFLMWFVTSFTTKRWKVTSE